METESINDVIRSMTDFNARARREIVRKALRDYGSAVVKRVKSNIKWKAPQTKRSVMMKIARYPKGGRPDTRKYLWLGVGVRTGLRPVPKRLDGRYGDVFPGWRSHLYEAGWRSWPKGRRQNDAAFAEILGARKRQGNYRGGDPNRARAVLAFVRRENRWRRGQRGVVGQRHYETRYISRAARATMPLLRTKLEMAVESARREMSRG